MKTVRSMLSKRSRYALGFPNRDRRSSSGHALRRLILGLTLAVPAAAGSMLAIPGMAGAQSPPIVYYPGNAGYGVYSTTTPPTSVSTQLEVPKVKCTTTKAAVSFGALIETADGSVAGDSAVALACNDGKAKYSAGILINGAFTTLPTTVRPGDLVTSSANQNASQTSVTFTDATTGFTQTSTGPGATSAFAFVGTFPVSSYKKVAKFTRFSFSNVAVNGADIGTYDASTGLFEAIETHKGEAPPTGTIEVEPGALGTSSFPLNWVSAG